MRKAFSLLSLAALTVGLLGSCSKINERIDGLEKRVDGIENEQIASINTQVEKINSSIADLGTIRENISSLKTTTEAQAREIAERKKAEEALGGRVDELEEQAGTLDNQVADLKEADIALGQRIDDLRTFVDDTLGAYATKEWVQATFSTLEQYEATCDTIAKIDARIGALDTKLSKDIQDCADSLKVWVNKQFEGYYTAAEVDAIVEDLQAQIDTLSKGDPRVDSLAAELTATKAAIETAKEAIRTEYRAAITSAITQSEGRMTAAINSAIASVNSKITPLTNDVADLKNNVGALTATVSKLLAMIQSVSITPAYSDGSVEAVDGILTLKCIVSPAEVLTGMESLKDSLLIYADSVKVKTKGASAYMEIEVSEAEIMDEIQGAIILTANISKYLPKGEDMTLTVAVNIKNGISNFTTEFVPVTVYIKPIPEGFVDLGVKTSAGKSLYWAECNLGASNPEDPGNYYMWGATALMYSAVDYTKQGGAFTFVTENPYGDNYKNTWNASMGFVWNNAPFTDGVYNNSDNKNVFTKYTTIDTYAKSGTPDNMTTLEDKDDAATAKNASWRMPTIDDFKSLVANCVLVWTLDYNSTSKAGYIVYKAKNEADKGKANINGTWKMWDAANSRYSANTGSEPTGYSTSDIHIFLPAAGIGSEANLNNYNTGGVYWSSSLATNNDLAFALTVMSGGIQISGGQRQYGYTIRPVTE